jgi:hypothetical protein
MLYIIYAAIVKFVLFILNIFLNLVWTVMLKLPPSFWIYICIAKHRLTSIYSWGRCGRDRMEVGFTNTYAISAFHHSPLMLWVRISTRWRCTTLCDKVCQWLATGRWFSLGPPVSSINKTYHHDITEILLKVAFNTIQPNQPNPFLLDTFPNNVWKGRLNLA